MKRLPLLAGVIGLLVAAVLPGLPPPTQNTTMREI